MANVRPMRAGLTDAEAEIRDAIDQFGKAFQAKNLEKILSFYAPGVVAYDMMPPLKHVGIGAWRKVWQDSLPMMTGEIGFEMRDLSIDVSGDLAVCHALNHFTMKNGETVDIWMRWTAGLRKLGGKWLVTHEHTSVPADMESGKAKTELKP